MGMALSAILCANKMRIFKTKWVHRWATKEGLNDASLRAAVDEMRRGLVDADLGGCVFKKRVAQPGEARAEVCGLCSRSSRAITCSSSTASPRVCAPTFLIPN